MLCYSGPPQVSLLFTLLHFITTWWHEINLLQCSVSQKGLLESSKRRQWKKTSLQCYRALSDNCMKNKMFVSKNDRQDRSLTGQVRDQAGHCPLTCRYFQFCWPGFMLIVEGVVWLFSLGMMFEILYHFVDFWLAKTAAPPCHFSHFLFTSLQSLISANILIVIL